MDGRHAYLIMCHSNLRILQILVQLLDDPRNDIYIHIDQKVKDYVCWVRQLHTEKATLTFTKRVNVNWGGFSQIKAELVLLEEATKTRHSYYHLLSGVDIPLKSQRDIHAFFAENDGKEFISIDENSITGEAFAHRLQYYRVFQDHIGRNHGKYIALMERLENLSLKVQRLVKINRLKYFPIPIYKGGNWFSITHQMALYILERKAFIRKHFRYGICTDELFLQTLAMTSPYAPNIVNDTLRYIDWNRGSPYTFTSEDFDLLLNSGKLFARKFDEKTDFSIVERLFAQIHSE